MIFLVGVFRWRRDYHCCALPCANDMKNETVPQVGSKALLLTVPIGLAEFHVLPSRWEQTPQRKGTTYKIYKKSTKDVTVEDIMCDLCIMCLI